MAAILTDFSPCYTDHNELELAGRYIYVMNVCIHYTYMESNSPFYNRARLENFDCSGYGFIEKGGKFLHGNVLWSKKFVMKYILIKKRM